MRRRAPVPVSGYYILSWELMSSTGGEEWLDSSRNPSCKLWYRFNDKWGWPWWEEEVKSEEEIVENIFGNKTEISMEEGDEDIFEHLAKIAVSPRHMGQALVAAPPLCRQLVRGSGIRGKWVRATSTP